MVNLTRTGEAEYDDFALHLLPAEELEIDDHGGKVG